MGVEQLAVSEHFARFTSFVSAINLLTQATRLGVPCRQIRASGSGTLVVKRASDATAQTSTFFDGETKMLACTEITSASGITAVEVFW